ncbi:probable tRNA N6-adenosine threonylcarbamoyltransferase, mitochondrial [Physcomitrium patens]|uniref:Glycoprotease 1 n=1 Tax=Physcomitrium patens TaxID=3218 RepID=A0A2K1JCS1_PHYPA|nr:probable tRNA N6-adenosine threonylcarbamoyltransferase, mitochondrial [Physcomitrium patens]PNR39309.1 hypothetical protein PHYPA_019587 [Physcomitrium patens]|eukprot:XP_024395864.1 probable tRNA N6-adenosine threonylcarbamoyltransferase, mitochondrial [Physcomitrella patens]
MALPVGMVHRRLVFQAAAWPRPAAMVFGAGGLRSVISVCGSLSRSANVARLQCRCSGSALRVRALHGAVGEGERGGGLVLGIETSCDDTGAAVVTTDGRILGEALASQADLLVQWGGVVPNLAQDAHAKAIDRVVAEALAKANVQEGDLSAVAVTIGPGLSMCLRVGVSKAREIARVHRLPMVGVHHMEAHALVVRLTEKGVEFPFVVLLVSGGHNLLLLAQDVGQYTQLGTTVDDAIGEAYDKTARLLGLDLKRGGGPALEQLALEGDANAFNFSVPMRHRQNCNFSYAGLKNQVRMAIASKSINAEVPLAEADPEDRRLRADLAASFQRVAVLHLEDRCRRALEWARKINPSVQCLVVSGGVASNQLVRSRLNYISQEVGLRLVCPPPRLCTDNGVMVAWAGIEHYNRGMTQPPPPIDETSDCWLDLRPRWQLGEICEDGLTDTHVRSLKKTGTHPSLTAQVRSFAEGNC